MRVARQPLALRIATLVLFAAIALMGVYLSVIPGWLWLVLGLLLAATGVWVAIRALRVGMTLTDDALIVRGYFATRTVRKGSIDSVDRFPMVDVHQGPNGTRPVAVTPFVGGGTDGASKRRKDAAHAMLKDWLRKEGEL